MGFYVQIAAGKFWWSGVFPKLWVVLGSFWGVFGGNYPAEDPKITRQKKKTTGEHLISGASVVSMRCRAAPRGMCGS